MNSLFKTFEKLNTKCGLIILDACFSGTKRDGEIMEMSRGVAIKVKDNAPQGNTIVISASQGDETAYPFEDQKHGMFTYYLLKKLQETSGNTSLGELTDYVKAEVSKQAFKEKNKTQTPSVYNSSELEDWRNITLK